MKVPSIWDSPKENTRKSFTQRDRMAVWDKEFGPEIDRAKCPICLRNEISRTHFAMGHKKPLAKGGTNTLRNIRPICFQCNTMMSTMNMSDYIKKYAPKSTSSLETTTTKTVSSKKTTKTTPKAKITKPAKKKASSPKSLWDFKLGF